MFLDLGMMRHGGSTLPGAIHTSGIYPSARLATSFVGQCWTPDQGGVYRVAASGKAQVRAAKWQSSDSSWIAPDTYPTRSVRTRFGTAKVPTGTSVGMVSSPAFTNKVTCRKTNPTDLTNIVKVGNTSAVLSVVTESAAALQSAIDVNGNTVDLTQICSTLKVYEVDNTLGGSGDAYIRFSGYTENTNKHSGRAFCSRVSGESNIRIGWSHTGSYEIGLFNSASYVQKQGLDLTVAHSSYQLLGSVPLGCKARFILPELVESSYLPADPIVPLTPAADTLAAFTRAAIYMEEDTAGVFPTVSVVETLEIGHVDNPYATQATRMSDGSVVPVVAGASWAQNFAIFGTCVPDAGGLYYVAIIGSIQTNEYTYVSIFPTGVWFNKFTSTAYLPTVINVGVVAGYTHAANAPFDYLAIQTIHGMALRVRPHATMVWSAWVTNITTGGKRAAILGPKYQIGSLNGVACIAGKHPKVSIFELGNQESLAAYQDRAMLLAWRITG